MLTKDGLLDPDSAAFCPDNQDWDWWLKLAPAVRGAAVSEFRKCYGEAMNLPAVRDAIADAMVMATYPVLAVPVNYKLDQWSAYRNDGKSNR